MPIKSRLKDEIQLDHVFIIEPPRILNPPASGVGKRGLTNGTPDSIFYL